MSGKYLIAMWIAGAMVGLGMHDLIFPKKEPERPTAGSITIAKVNDCSYLIYKDTIIHKADCTNHATVNINNLTGWPLDLGWQTNIMTNHMFRLTSPYYDTTNGNSN